MKEPVVISIEDDHELYRLIALTLETLPLTLVHASNGREGVEMVKRLAPSLILLDISLPDLHGWEVLRTLKDEYEIVPENVIVLTTHTDPRHRVMAHFQDVTAYLSKPFSPRELARLVADTLNIPYAHQSTA